MKMGVCTCDLPFGQLNSRELNDHAGQPLITPTKGNVIYVIAIDYYAFILSIIHICPYHLIKEMLASFKINEDRKDE